MLLLSKPICTITKRIRLFKQKENLNYKTIMGQSENKPQIGFMPPGSEKSNRVRMEEFEEKTMHITLVSSKRGIIKTPVAEIIARSVGIPFLDWQVYSNLHPMPLCFKITKLWRISSTRIRVD